MAQTTTSRAAPVLQIQTVTATITAAGTMVMEEMAVEETKVNIVKGNTAKGSAKTFHLFLIRTKGILSTITLMLLIPVAFSGIGLYFAPSGRFARTSGWSFLGFSKTELQALHNIPGIILVIAISLHFLLNLKLYLKELKCLFIRNKVT